MNKLKLQHFLASNCTKFVFGISVLYSSVFVVNAYGLPIINQYGSMLEDARSTNNFTLTAIANNKNNNVSLNWSLDNNSNKIYKVYKKTQGNNTFQSISATNFESTKKVRVLNIHPNIGEIESFSTWDGEKLSLPKSASLKRWMEEPNSENSKGYGKGIIEVTPVTQAEFNANPYYYLKDTQGNWKYDVIYQGHWDTNYNQVPNDAALNAYTEFINDGYGFLAGHDTIGWDLGTNRGLSKLRNLFNVKIGYWQASSIPTDEGHHYSAGFKSNQIYIQKKGLLTNYPWSIGDIGSSLTIPNTHSTSNFAYGDIWITFPNGALWGDRQNPSHLQNVNNFYLTTWNNTAMIQTGHSNGSATPDEQKILANTLFYLNQLSTSTSLVDNDGQDVTAPELPKLTLSSANTSSATYAIESIKDIGSNYEYYVIAEDKKGSTSQSNTVRTTVTSGLQGYSYVIDNSPTTTPNNVVNLNTSTNNIKVNITDNNKEYYIHIKSIDNRNNASETVHIKVDAPKLTATANNSQNNVSLNWSLVDDKNKIFKVYKKIEGNTTFQSISATNFNDTKQVKVLNIHPNAGTQAQFTTWNNETLSLPKSASLKRWMEEPNAENNKGYGKGIIKVSPVSIHDFNRNPSHYLFKDSNGNWNYDVIMIGTWDSNARLDINNTSLPIIKQFIEDGKGILFGHDSIGYLSEMPNIRSLSTYLNLLPNGGLEYNGNQTGYGSNLVGGISSINIKKRGLLTNYPWNIGDIGTALTVPGTHSLGQIANGDIWMNFNGANYPASDNSNFYLTSWNNTAMIQTGHSNGNATPDEQKILANTLFYLNQLSTSTSLVDNDGQDVTAPELPKLTLSSANTTSATYSISSIKDIGTKYEYYVTAEDKNGNTFKSNTVKTTVTSGLKGYSYVIDNSPNTNPTNTVNLNTSTNNLTVNMTDNNKEYYIHIKSIDNRNNASETVHIKIDAPKLTATANNNNNNVSLKWSLIDDKNKIFKVYKKMEGNKTFQSISVTNFNDTKQIKVLNIHPNVGSIASFSTWDNETLNLPKSASLKRWMEEPQTGYPKGYGMGLIEVDVVTQADFNANPTNYLKNADGTWKYDVLANGFYDSNGSQDLTDASIKLIREFVADGKGYLCGHDTINGQAPYANVRKTNKLRDLLNIKFHVDFNNMSAVPMISGNVVQINKKGLLLNYPHQIGEIGTKLTVPSSHSTSQLAYGDIWMTYYGQNPTTDFNGAGTNNFYLTSWNNTAMIQTGHSNGSATPDEQKILANTLFYLNQLSTSTSLVDNDGQDVTAPELPKLTLSSTNTTSATYTIESIKDIGTKYEYYVTAEDKNSNILKSNIASATVTSGLKGYSYVIDNSPNTNPDNIVNLNTSTNSITVDITDTNKEYYIHIKSIDNRNNASETVHIKIDAPKLTATANNNNNNVSLKWSLVNDKNKIFKVYKKHEGSNTFQSISTTNFESVEQVKVLNVYPNKGNNLKKWMEQSTHYIDKNGQRVEVPNGYGKNIIKVDEVSINDFNANPTNYLKNSDGSFKYNVIMFGTWDANNYFEINLDARNIVEEFILSGRGVLFGHDTVCSNNKWANFTYLGEKYLNMVNNGVDTTRYSSITVAKKGLLTNYPWLVGDLGSQLTIPSTHTLGQSASGDIWMTYTGASASKNNFYLTTWNNVAMIQTGHSNASATPDEQKLLANTLFYLNQLSTSTSLVDNDGQDVTAPELPKLTLSSSNTTSATYVVESIKDIGTKYEYYVTSEDKNGNIFKSNTASATVTSGLKGYSYVIDNSPNTEPANTVNLNISTNNIKVDITDINKAYYIHIKSIDNRDNASITVHIRIDAPILTATANNKNNNVSLNWSLADKTNKIFKVYKKHEGSDTFQSISTTNFENAKKVKVLNIYPTAKSGEGIPLKTDGSTDLAGKTESDSALLHDWIKEYGLGKIDVDSINQEDFELEPNKYLKDAQGNYLYDVVVVGFWNINFRDSHINDNGMEALSEFVDSGRGILTGHHHIGLWQLDQGMNKLKDKFGIKFVVESGWTSTEQTPIQYDYIAPEKSPSRWGSTYWHGSDKVIAKKKGLLLNYPWNISQEGRIFNIPYSHNSNDFVTGDVWLEYYDATAHNISGNTPANNLYTLPDGTKGSKSAYLSTYNNTALIQTGHSSLNGRLYATEDEKKILANTIFYLNQISYDTSLTDNSGQDVKAPDAPSVNLLAPTSSELHFDFSDTKDNGSKYEYYVISEDKRGNKIQSNTASATVTTGIKGYSYVVDTNPTTEPSNTINLTNNTLTINNLANNTTYYLHIKAIDNANNVSKTTHFKISTAAPTTPVLNLSRTGWGNTDVRFTISQNHNKNIKILSLSDASSTPFVSKLTALGYNVVSKPNLTNIDEIKKYDIVISDYYCWTVANGALLEKLYNNGVKLITIGNDTSNSILPILSTKRVGSEANLTIARNIKNEATFALPSYNPGRDSASDIITQAISNSTTWYTTTAFNTPSILSMQNGRGGQWIHSQCILGGNGTDNLIMGLIDYLTQSISQFHLQDVQYKVNDGNWISYNGEEIVLSDEGNYHISVRNIDTRGVASMVDTQTVGIDKTAPKGTAYTNKTTTSRNITVTLDALEDKLSGLNKVRTSTYSDFRDSNGYTSISNKHSIALQIELPFLSDLEENYSSRTIYIEIQDKAGNKKILNCSTIYEPKNPTVAITSPKTNTFVTSNESITISWDYQGNNNDNVVLPQSKAIITATQIDSNNAKTFSLTVTGAANTAILPKLETGEYSVTVTAYNSFDKYAVSEPIQIRCNIFDITGDLNTKPISIGSPLRFISVFSDVEIPAGTQINGYIYYAENESDAFNEQNKIEFTIASDKISSDIIKLPYTSSKIKIYYELYNKSTNKQLSPALCRITVLGK